MSVITLTTQNSASFIADNKDKFIILVFNANFSGQEDLVEDALKEVIKFVTSVNNAVVASVDAEVNPELTTEFSVLVVPEIVCLTGENKNVLKKIDTIEPQKLINLLSKEYEKFTALKGSSITDSAAGETNQKDKFQQYLKHLTNKAPVMVFMKGEPSAPRCGFSKQLVAMLAKYDIIYDHFDILEDDEVRQGLKEYSDWPTYPQIYVKGEFIGGLDILKQLDENGELKSTLEAETNK